MHCPNCGTKATDKQNFCRYCGLNLEKISQVLTEQLPELDTSLFDKQRKIEGWAKVAGISFGVLITLIMLGALGYASLYEKDAILPVSLALMMLVGGMLAISLSVYSASLRRKIIEQRKLQAITQVVAETTNKLSSEPQQILLSSVTEKTTELLEAGNTPEQQSKAE
ncbi:MAG: zinc ribbon domain-containing protein [Acidobacteriota bacterium]